MRSWKTVADGLTAGRCVLGLTLLWIGWRYGATALPAAIVLLVCAWISDLLDGTLAHHDPHPHQTWIGTHDLAFDVIVGIGTLGYLALAGYLTASIALVYLVSCTLLVWVFQSRALAMLSQAWPYGMVLLIGLHEAPLYSILALTWLACAIALTWPRFPREVVPGFIRGMRMLARRRHEHS